MIDKNRNFKEPDFIRDLEEILQITKSALDDTVDNDVDVTQELRGELKIAYDNAYSAYYEAIKYDYKMSDVILASAFFTLGCKTGEWIRTSLTVETMQKQIHTTRENYRQKGAPSPFREHEPVILDVIKKYEEASKGSKFTQNKAIAEIEKKIKLTVGSGNFNRWLALFRENGVSIFTTVVN